MVTRKTKPTPKTAPTKLKQPVARNWRTYGYYALAVIWGLLTIGAYVATFSTNTVAPGFDPHPVVDEHSIALPSFQDALLTSLLPLLPLAMFISTIALIRFARGRRVILIIQLIVALGILVYAHATSLWSASYQGFSPAPQAQKLDDVIVRRLQCGDAVRIVDNYGFGAKTFYELKDKGYVLKATYQSNTGILDSETACETYYDIRSQYPSDRIVLQLFVLTENNQPRPYLYKYAERTDAIQYGIFVKE
ncbi:MAG: hypothetical protein WBP12_05855 [Candidatus Saccharimonas sp.]